MWPCFLYLSFQCCNKFTYCSPLILFSFQNGNHWRVFHIHQKIGHSNLISIWKFFFFFRVGLPFIVHCLVSGVMKLMNLFLGCFDLGFTKTYELMRNMLNTCWIPLTEFRVPNIQMEYTMLFWSGASNLDQVLSYPKVMWDITHTCPTDMPNVSVVSLTSILWSSKTHNGAISMWILELILPLDSKGLSLILNHCVLDSDWFVLLKWSTVSGLHTL